MKIITKMELEIMGIDIPKLPREKKKIIKALLSKINSKYKNDIAVVVCYGSYITGNAYQKSDLDFFFIPKTEKGYEMNMQFIINDIGYDFWPLSWERAERIASFKENNTSIIAEGVVVYYNQPSDLNKFNLLKQKISELTKNDKNNTLINRAQELITEAKAKYFNMNNMSKGYKEVDSYCSHILNLLANIVALLNSSYIKKGVYNINNEFKNFTVLPDDFLHNFNSAVRTKSIENKKELTKRMILQFDELLKAKQLQPKVAITEEKFRGFYEEIKSNYNKLRHACDNKDYVKAYFTAHLIEQEVHSMLGDVYNNYNFPYLIKAFKDNDLEKIKSLTNQHEDKLINLLKNYNIDYIKFKNADELIANL